MNEKSRWIQVSVGPAMEYHMIEGDEETARRILKPYGIPKSPAILRLEREDVAKMIAERLKPAASRTLAPLPENLL